MLAPPTIELHEGWALSGPFNKLMTPIPKVVGAYRSPRGFFTEMNKFAGDALGSIMRYDSERAMFDKEPYSPVHPRSTSLQCNEGNVDSEFIEFRREMKLAVDIGKKKKPIRDYCKQFPAVPLYHSHVLWSYAPRISLVGDGKYSFALVSVGPHLSACKEENKNWNLEEKDPANKNIPPRLCAPPLVDASVVFSNADGTVNDFFDLVASDDGSYAVSEPFTRAQLRALTVDGKSLAVCLYVTAPRSYFSLPSVIDLTVKPTVSTATLSTVVQILRGEKPDGFDCKLRGGHSGMGDSSVEYFVHRAVLESKNPAFKKSGDIPLHSIESFVCSLNAEGLAVAVRIAYGVDVPLPKSLDNGMFITLQRMFGDHFTAVVVPQWERDICRKALALDARNTSSSSIAALLRLLNAIFEAPYGHFPVGKRVAVGVLADMMHLGPHTTVFDFVQDTFLPSFPESGMTAKNLPAVLTALASHLHAIPHVAKVAAQVADSPSEAEPEAKSEAGAGPEAEIESGETGMAPSELPYPEAELPYTVVELPYPEDSTDIDVPATRACAIL